MKKYLLGIDVGTTGTKTYLFSADGENIAHAYRGYECFTPDTETSEQSADEIWDAVVETVRKATESIEDKRSIVAISLSTQGGTLVPTDKDFNPVCNAIVWNDKSCAPEMKKFAGEMGGADLLYNLTGWGLGNGLPLLQTRRLKDRKNGIFQKADLFLTIPDYVSAKMTGKPVTDMSNAGINQFIDVRRGNYDSRLLNFAGINEDMLPGLALSGEPIGKLTSSAAEELGLSTETVFVTGAHDQYAVAVGAGAVNDGDIIIGSGTCWVVTSINSLNDFSSGLAQSVSACGGMWGSLLSLPYGGACVEWMRKKVIAANGAQLGLKEIDDGCLNLRAAEDGLFFYPFQSILSNDRKTKSARAQFIGLDVSHNAFNMSLAIMEGVAFQVKWMAESFPKKKHANGIRLTGGASKSALWSQIIADVLDCPVIIPIVPDIACVGAAVIAGVGSGVFESFEEGCGKLMQNEKTVYPDREKAEMYKNAYRLYKKNAEYIGKLKTE